LSVCREAVQRAMFWKQQRGNYDGYVQSIVKNMTVLLAAGMLFSANAQAEVIGSPAPDFTLKSRSGENVKLSELRGEVVMINFWPSRVCALPTGNALVGRYSQKIQ